MTDTTAPVAPAIPATGRIALVTPCHGVPFSFSMETVGPAYLTYEKLDEIYCDAPTCNNTWSPTGEPAEWNK